MSRNTRYIPSGETPEDAQTPPIDHVDFSPMLALLDELEAREHDTVRAGKDTAPKPTTQPDARRDGHYYVVPSPDRYAMAFAYRAHGLIDRGFNWSRYISTPRVSHLLEQLRAGNASELSLDDARKIMIALARNDRFNDGAVQAAINNGFILTILRRVRELLENA